MNFFTPAEVAKNYIATGKAKVNTPETWNTFAAVCELVNKNWTRDSKN